MEIQSTIEPVTRSGHPSLLPDQASAVRALLLRTRDERYGGNATALATALSERREGASRYHVTQSALSQIFSGKNRPSYQTADALARLLRVDVSSVLSGAAPVVADQIPERGAALARLRGLLSPAVEEEIRTTAPTGGAPFSELDWLELALARQRDAERVADLERRVARPAHG